MSFPEWVQVVSNVAMGVSAVVVAIIAFVGLNQWRAQLKGNTEYDIARRTLRAVLAVRDTIRNYRSPFMSSGEFAERKSSEDERKEETRVLDSEYGYRNRLIEVQKAALDLWQIELETKALWGSDSDVVKSLEPLHKCLRELFAAHDTYFSLSLEEARGRRADEKFRKDMSRIVHGLGSNDEYAKDLDAAVTQCEDAFRVYLK